jgi:hypothetical protein
MRLCLAKPRDDFKRLLHRAEIPGDSRGEVVVRGTGLRAHIEELSCTISRRTPWAAT